MNVTPGETVSSDFVMLPAQFVNDRVFVCPVTETGIGLKFYTDTGGGGLLIDPDLVAQLGLPLRGKDGELFVPFPQFHRQAYVPAGTQSDELLVVHDLPIGAWGPSGPWGQGLLGQSWFSNRIWKLDYQRGQLGYLPKGSRYETADFRCVEVGLRQEADGEEILAFPRIQASIDGEPFNFMFDTGATVHLTSQARTYFKDTDTPVRATSFIVESVFNQWRARHPDWVVVEQADQVGDHPMIEVPAVRVAEFDVGPVWFTMRRDWDFHEYISQWTDKQVSGALVGSLFRYFSMIIDYPAAVAYFKR